MTDKQKLIEELKGLLPSLKYSQETHRQWRDCDQSYRDRNPQIGDVKFHQDCFDEYQTRIDVISRAITALEAKQSDTCTCEQEWDEPEIFDPDPRVIVLVVAIMVLIFCFALGVTT